MNKNEKRSLRRGVAAQVAAALAGSATATNSAELIALASIQVANELINRLEGYEEAEDAQERAAASAAKAQATDAAAPQPITQVEP